MKQKVGVFLGSFNPIHNGHMYIAESVIKDLKLDRVLLLPLYDAPHKTCDLDDNSSHRVKMCKLACEGHKGIETSTLEIDHKVTGYSIEMIDIIKNKFSDDDLYYVVGSDVFMSILRWDELDLLISRVTFVVVMRDKVDPGQLSLIKKVLERRGAHVHFCDFDVPNISSSEVKNNIMTHEALKEILPKKVFEYIQKHRLYQSNC